MVSNNSSCDIVVSVPLLRVISATNAASAVVCLLASAMVFCLKLYKIGVYRLALYQISASLAFSIVQVSQIAFVHYNNGNDALQSRVRCDRFPIPVHMQWAKLVLTIWLTAHLFCFSVFQNNLRRLEVAYVATSLIVPAGFAGVALCIRRSYGLGEFGCWISVTCRNENSSFHRIFVESLALWDGPAAFILLIASVAMVVMTMKLAVNIHRRRRYARMSSDDQFWKALKLLLPLAAFPVLFYAFVIPQLAFHIYQFEFQATYYQLPKGNDSLYIATSASFSVWSFVSGLTLIVHVCVARLSRHCKDKATTRGEAIEDEGSITVTRETTPLLNSATSFPLPIENTLN